MHQQAEPQRPAEHMTKEQWRKTHRDFKATINGQRFVLRMTPQGTAMVPVFISKEKQ